MNILPKNCVTMKCKFLLVTVLIINVKAAPYIPNPEHRAQTNQQQLEQRLLNQIAQQSMDQWILQNKFHSMQQQMMALNHLQTMKKTQYGTVPELTPYNLPQQPLLLLLPSTIPKTSNRYENLDDYEPHFKKGVGDADSVVINAENSEDRNIAPQRAVVVLPNGQRLIIGSIISLIPFLPFEVNVPDTIGWIYNGISGIIGGIGQRLPFRPKPTTESPVQQTQEPMPSTPELTSPNQEPNIIGPETEMIPTEENSMKILQKLMYRRPNLGMPILMLPVT